MAGTRFTPAGGNSQSTSARTPVTRFGSVAQTALAQMQLPEFKSEHPNRHGSTTDCALDDSDWRQLNSALRLTNRELEVVKSVFHAQTEAGIAVELGISINTVHTHLGRVYKKLGVHSAAGLILRVFSEFIQHSRRDNRVPER